MTKLSLVLILILSQSSFAQNLLPDLPMPPEETEEAPATPTTEPENAEKKIENQIKVNKNQLIKEFYIHFKKAEYIASLDSLKQLEKSSTDEAFSIYWQGIVNNKLERYKDSIEAFKKADKMKVNYKDMYYEYAQALYAADLLKPSRKAFGKSIVNKHKVPTSLYYMGFISQTLEDYKSATNYYKKINSLEDSQEKKDVNQAARMQLAEIYVIQAVKSKDPRKQIKKYAIPEFEYAYGLDVNSSLAPEIKKRILDLQDKYDLVLLKMANGRPTTIPRLYLKLSQEFRYDTNVVLEANQVQSPAQDKGAPISKTEVLSRYAFYPSRRISLIPEFRGNYTKHIDSDTPSIYQNDNYSLTPALRSSYEYTIGQKMSSTLLDFDYNYSARDVYQRKELNYNGRTLTYMLGEKLNFLSLGETTVRYRLKDFSSYNETYDSKTNSFSFEQMLILPKGHVMFIVGSYDMTKVKNESLNTDSYLLRLDYITPRIKDWVTPTLSFTTLFNDPYNQKVTRGLEKMYNPGVKLTRGFGHWRGNLKYDYTRNISKDKTAYDYTKHVYGFELEYLF